MTHFRRSGAALLLALPVLSLAAAEPVPSTIAVNGHGEVSVAPDRARLSLAIDTVDADLKRAEARVNRVVRVVVDGVKAQQIAAADLTTTAVSMQPEYVWDEKERRQVLVGYRARRDLQIVVRELDRLGDVLLLATAAGVNHVQPPQMESSRAEALGREALARAAEDAQAKADVLARALKVKLGPARSVRESGGVAPPVPYKVMAMRAEADSGSAQMGLESGQIQVSADVAVEFAIEGR